MPTSRYQVYGVNMISDFEFPNDLPAGDGDRQLAFRIRRQPPATSAELRHRYSYPESVDRRAHRFHFHEWDRGYVLGFVNIADFYIEADTITCHLTQPRHEYMIGPLFLGVVMAFWLELRGQPVLHGSAVSVDGHALLFVGPQQAGKSTLAACFAVAGERLIADDLLPLERQRESCAIHPSYPEIRLWRQQMTQLFPDDHHRSTPAHDDTAKRRLSLRGAGLAAEFSNARQRIARIYLPSMSAQANGISLQPLAPADGLISLLSQSFLDTLLETLLLPFRQRRLAMLASVVDKVTVTRLVYGPGAGTLAHLRRRIFQDLGCSTLAS